MSGLEDACYQGELVGLLFWMLKDIGWVFLFPAVALPAGLAALGVETYILIGQWESIVEVVHSAVTLVWLLGNCAWMATELLCSPSPEPGRQFPWFHGPLLGNEPDKEKLGVRTAQGIFLFGLVILLVLYAAILGKFVIQEVRKREGLEPLAVHGAGAALAQLKMTMPSYRWLFLGPWIAKDFCWSCSNFTCAIVFAALAIAVIVDYLRRFHSLIHLAELIWVLANVVWLFSELPLEDAYRWPRVVAGFMLIADCHVVAAALWRTWYPKRPIWSEPSESTALCWEASGAAPQREGTGAARR